MDMLGNSLVVGYCICASCGWTDNKFNWHTYFKCPSCGSLQYVKPDLWGDLLYGETKKNEIDNKAAENEQEKEVDVPCDTVVAIFDSW